MKLRLAETTQQILQDYRQSRPQAILLTGPRGVGLFTLAHYIVEQNGTLLVAVQPESKTTGAITSIAVDKVRQLYDYTRAAYDGLHFVIIDDADAMNASAQNALLKLLEEPNESIRFILTSHSPDRLLPTIRSRTQLSAIAPLSTIESRRLLHSLGINSAVDEQRLLFVADGLPAEIARLASDPAAFKQIADRVQRARIFVEGSTYHRLALVIQIKDDRAGSLLLIDTIIMLLRKSLATNPDRSTVELIDRLMTAAAGIRMNANIKLQLCRAVVGQ